MALTRRIGREAVTWIALGLVVASILIVTTRHAAGTKPVAKQANPAQRITTRKTTTVPPRNSRRLDHRPDRLVTSETPTSTTSSTSTTTTTETVTSTTGANVPSTLTTSATLSYPGDVATTYPLSVASGPLSAKLRWQRGSELSLTMTCGRSVIARNSARGSISLALARVSGGCELRIARTAMAGSAIAYSLALSYLPTNPAG